jgi:hypothetical protein
VEPVLTPALAAARDGLVALATELAGRQAAAGLPVAAEEYVRNVLHMGLMEVREGRVWGAAGGRHHQQLQGVDQWRFGLCPGDLLCAVYQYLGGSFCWDQE